MAKCVGQNLCGDTWQVFEKKKKCMDKLLIGFKKEYETLSDEDRMRAQKEAVKCLKFALRCPIEMLEREDDFAE
jgi:ferredoxin